MLLSDSRDQKDECVSDLFKLPIIEPGKNGVEVILWMHGLTAECVTWGVNSYSMSK